MVPQGSAPSNAPLMQSHALTAVAAGVARARLRADVAASLGALVHTPMSGWSGLGLVRVKERTVRSVFAGEVGGVPVHVKVFRAHTLADRARDLVGRERGEREHDNLVRLADLGLPVVTALGFGMADDEGSARSFVVTRSLRDSRPFTFPPPAAVGARTGALLRRLHDAGVAPGDLHPGNLLVDAHGEPWLCDLTSVRIGREATLAQRAVALAFFCHELDRGPQDPAADDLLRAYLSAGAPLPASFAHELTLATHRWRAAALPAFGRRATRTCRHTAVEPRRRGTPNWHWHLEGGLDEACGAKCRLFVAEPPTPTKTGRRGSVWLQADLVVKSREAAAARHLWRAHYWLAFARVATPTPVAFCKAGSLGYVFTERLAGPDLRQEVATGTLTGPQLRQRARSLGAQVGRLHAHGLRNRDLKLENLIYDPLRGAVCMVDLDGIRRKAALDTRGEGHDLGRLLAAFRAAGSPGGNPVVATFLRAWLGAHRSLLRRPPARRILGVAAARAANWASAHRQEDGDQPN